MKINKIGVIGNGYVGNALYLNLKQKYETFVYDVEPSKSLNSYDDTIKADIVFVCLPTPMLSAEGGECNLNIIENFFSNIPKNTDSLFVIKSTIPIGTTKKLKAMREDLRIVHNPEFLTATNSVEDYKNSYRNVIGSNDEDTSILETLMTETFPNAKNIFVSTDESEMIKYFANTFLALKVAYFNMIYDMSVKTGANYRNIVDGVCSDVRIGNSHSTVPGPDGNRGFGGTCFPKDINALIHAFKTMELNPSILEEVWEYNKTIRSNWDWATNKSAVLKKDE